MMRYFHAESHSDKMKNYAFLLHYLVCISLYKMRHHSYLAALYKSAGFGCSALFLKTHLYCGSILKWLLGLYCNNCNNILIEVV